MDPVIEIKARLPIDQLVSQYCQIEKKGSSLKCICPFHNDSHPSMLVSPDKGIAYCFACQSGGDIFSFYQKIEGVDFKQALKDLADKTGVEIEEMSAPSTTKDEKERLRECLEKALSYYKSILKAHEGAKEYLKKRGIDQGQIELFELGVAPDSFSETYEHLLKSGFSNTEIIGSGLVVQKDIQSGKIYDRFRNRLMFPIHDAQGRLVGFGGRTLGNDDAKYINSSDGPLYHKSNVLYGYHLAKDEIRTQKNVVMVEGYFDVLACHRIGITNVIAVSGTALTSQHVSILKRTCESVTLCLDQDRAGKDAAEKAFHLCSQEGLLVQSVSLSHKDPDEALNADAEAFKSAITTDKKPYMDMVLDELSQEDTSSVTAKRMILKRVLPLLNSLPTAVEKSHYLSLTASLLGTTEMALQEDMKTAQSQEIVQPREVVNDNSQSQKPQQGYSRLQIALALMISYSNTSSLHSVIEPDESFERSIYLALKDLPEVSNIDLEMLDLEESDRERLSILLLFCEHHEMTQWTEALAVREIEKNIQQANRDTLKTKQKNIAKQLMLAKKDGKRGEEEKLNTQYQEVLKLLKMAKG